jgi:protocatechuate 3,4-dioxygenase beta subunit
MSFHIVPSRRRFLQQSAFASALFTAPGLFAEQLLPTASIGEGPFYPDKLPLDTDNDLILLNDSITPALGQITHLSGRVLSSAGVPVRSAFVEIWQVCGNGVYLHSGSSKREKYDRNFQGYGRFLTDSKGQYYFRTLRPVPYPGRTPHIHIAVSMSGKRIFTSQILIKDNPLNAQDGLARSVRDPKALATLMAEFKPLPNSKIGEQTASFDVVLGRTWNEDQAQELKGVAPSNRSRRQR